MENPTKAEEDEDKEIKLLKQTVKALATLCIYYRIGGSPPEWVFEAIAKAKQKYDQDLTKIK